MPIDSSEQVTASNRVDTQGARLPRMRMRASRKARIPPQVRGWELSHSATRSHICFALYMKPSVLYHALWLFYIGIEKYPLHTVRAALALFSVRAFVPAKLYQCGAYPDAVGFF